MKRNFLKELKFIGVKSVIKLKQFKIHLLLGMNYR